MSLPVELPDGPYTLRALELYLTRLTLHFVADEQALGVRSGGLPKPDFTRSPKLLHRVVSLYQQITGISLGTIQGRRRNMLAMTREQFELMATVVYRSVMDGTSYEYNIRRELGLPDEGYGLLAGPVSAASSSEVAPSASSAELATLKEELAQLSGEVAQLEETIDGMQQTMLILMDRLGIDAAEADRLLANRSQGEE